MKISNINYQSFCAMKPNQFSGIDYACVRKFKAPVEKFDKKEDLYSWAVEQLNTYIAEKNVAGPNKHTKVRRAESIFEWRNAIGFNLNKSTVALVALSSLLKDLSSNNDRLPPILSKTALNEALDDLENCLAENKDLQFNFKTIYCNHLKKLLNEENYSNYTGWVQIPSKLHDPNGYEKNVEMLKILSYDTWCTKNYHSEVLLQCGDFYIYLEKGKPKLGLCFEDRVISEIQGESNDGKINVNYFDILHKFICERNLALSGKALETYHKTKNKVLELQSDITQH